MGFNDPNSFCPICGGKYNGKHKCPQATLDAIDRMRSSDYDHRESKKPYSQRLSAGFEMLDDDAAFDVDDDDAEGIKIQF